MLVSKKILPVLTIDVTADHWRAYVVEPAPL